MKRFNLIISFFLTVLLAASCELIDDLASGDDTITKLEGQWKCDENSQKYKKSTMDEAYHVYISPYPGDSTRVIISNFYHLGDDVEATARLSGQTLTLSNQSLPGGFTILSGSGTISSSFKLITWSYRIDDGSGDVDNVTATYTKIY